MKYHALIVKIRRNQKQNWKNVYAVVMALETDTLADVALKLAKTQRRADESGEDDDTEYKVFFAVN